MSNNKRFNTKAYGGLMMFTIAVLGQVIRYFVGGEFRFTRIIGAFLGTAPLVLANIIYVRRKKDNTPEIDERTRQNVLKFIAYASQIIFLILMAGLAVISFMEVESISIISLWIVILLNMFVIGVGSMIVMRR